MVSIRGFRSADLFFENYLKLVDADAALVFLSNAALEWLVLRIEALQNLILVTAAFFLLLLPKTAVTPGTKMDVHFSYQSRFYSLRNCLSIISLVFSDVCRAGGALPFLCIVDDGDIYFHDAVVLQLVKLHRLRRKD